MHNLVDALDVLKNALDTEATLRQATNAEWASGSHDGPMKRAHDTVIQQVIEAAKKLIELSK